MELKTDAIVLRAIDYKDNDKILTLFTPSKGKITAGIKGVKKPSAKLSFAAQPFCFAEYILTEKSGRYTVTSAYLYDGFFNLRTDIERYYAACSVLEICNVLLVEDGESQALFLAAVNALKLLSMTDDDSGEVFISFCLKALKFSGYRIALNECGVCGEKVEGKINFDFESGFFTCPQCNIGTRASQETYEVMRKCSGLSYNHEKTDGGVKRALRLIKQYLIIKTEEKFPCFGEYIRLYE